jgi:uncharacterized membrane protein YeiB
MDALIGLASHRYSTNLSHFKSLSKSGRMELSLTMTLKVVMTGYSAGYLFGLGQMTGILEELGTDTRQIMGAIGTSHIDRIWDI